jgi:hypothetical protein
MHECTDIVAGRQQDDFKFSLLCAHLLLSTLQDAVHRMLCCFAVTAALLF